MTTFHKEINTKTPDVLATVRRPLTDTEMKMITGGNAGGTPLNTGVQGTPGQSVGNNDFDGGLIDGNGNFGGFVNKQPL